LKRKRERRLGQRELKREKLDKDGNERGQQTTQKQ